MSTSKLISAEYESSRVALLTEHMACRPAQAHADRFKVGYFGALSHDSEKSHSGLRHDCVPPSGDIARIMFSRLR